MKLIGYSQVIAISLFLVYNIQARPQPDDLADALNGALLPPPEPCSYGYRLVGENCEKNVCQCAGDGVGLGVEDHTLCPNHDDAMCAYCHIGSVLTGDPALAPLNMACVKYDCSCDNGNAPATCPTDGPNVCQSCNAGYHLTQMEVNHQHYTQWVNTCKPNECSCHNGYINDDFVCPHHGMNYCSGCEENHFLQNDGNACIPIVKQNMFYYNVNPSNEDIQQYNHKDEINRYDQNTNNLIQNQINQQNDWNEALNHEPTDLPRCICSNGIPAYGAACPSDGASVCLSCFKGYHQDGDDCPINVCTCSTGDARNYPVNGLLCLVDGAEECASPPV